MIAFRLLAAIGAILLSAPFAILDLDGASPGPGIPPHWRTRAVRGQLAPDTDLSIDEGSRRFRLQGAGRAAWFYRDLDTELPESPGTLRWSWRVRPAG